MDITNSEKENKIVVVTQFDNQVQEDKKDIEREPTANKYHELTDLADQAFEHGNEEDRYQEKSDDKELESLEIEAMVDDKDDNDDSFEVPITEKDTKNLIDEQQVDSSPIIPMKRELFLS